METRHLSISLFALAVIASSTSASAMGKKPVRYQLTGVTQIGNSYSVQGKDSRGLALNLTPGTLGCVKLVRGPNLAACLVGCDGKAAVQLAQEPVYADVYREIEVSRFSGAVERSIRADSDVQVTIKPAGKRKAPRLVTPKGAPTDLCTPAQLARFDGDGCVAQVTSAIFDASVAKTDPLTAYGNELAEAIALPKFSPESSEALTHVEQSYRNLQKALLKAGRQDFLHGGYFVAQNLKNAPALLCQLRSQVNDLGGPTRALLAALEENQAELDHSLEFLTRYNEAHRQ